MNSIRKSPDSYRDRDLRILKFVHRYQLAFHELTTELFFEGKNSNHVLKRLAAQGLLEIKERVLPGGMSYVVLTKRGLAAIGFEEAIPATLSNASRSLALATSFFCVLGGEKKRARMVPKEVNHYLSKKSSAPHVYVPNDFEIPVVLRVHHATGKVRGAVRSAMSFLSESKTKPHLRGPIAERQYGLLVLCPTKEKVTELTDAMRKADAFSIGRLTVALGPNDETLARTLRDRRRRLSG